MGFLKLKKKIVAASINQNYKRWLDKQAELVIDDDGIINFSTSLDTNHAKVLTPEELKLYAGGYATINPLLTNTFEDIDISFGLGIDSDSTYVTTCPTITWDIYGGGWVIDYIQLNDGASMQLPMAIIMPDCSSEYVAAYNLSITDELKCVLPFNLGTTAKLNANCEITVGAMSEFVSFLDLSSCYLAAKESIDVNTRSIGLAVPKKLNCHLYAVYDNSITMRSYKMRMISEWENTKLSNFTFGTVWNYGCDEM